MSEDFTVKTAPAALGLSERTVRRRLGYYRDMQAGRRLKAWQRALAIPYRHRLGYPYRIPAEVIDALRRVEAVA